MIRNRGRQIIPYQWELVILLWLTFFFNQADRQVFNVVLPFIQRDLNLSFSEMGMIASVLTLIYGLLVPVSGIAGDRLNKKNIIIISLLFWSSATLLTGFSNTLFDLIILRSIATGGGEAFYSPSANALISQYHNKTRATALAIHQTALYAGIISSGYIAGYVADLYGWRRAFFIFGGFGIVLSVILYFRLKAHGDREDAGIPAAKKSIKETLGVLLKKPTVLLLALAFAGMQFVGVAFLTWMPTFLRGKFRFSLARAGFDATFYHHVGALAGVLAGASIADSLSRKYASVRVIIQMTGLFLGAPFIYIMSKSDSLPVIYISFALFGVCRGIYDSNIFASLYDVVEAPYRSTATGIMLMFAFTVGSLSPYLLGVLEPRFGLSGGLASLSMVYLFSGCCLLVTLCFFYKKDHIPQHESGLPSRTPGIG